MTTDIDTVAEAVTTTSTWVVVAAGLYSPYLLELDPATGTVFTVATDDDMQRHLWSRWRRLHPHCVPQPHTGPARAVADARTHGTSGDVDTYGWTADHIPIRGVMLSRLLLASFANAVVIGDNTTADLLIDGARVAA